MRTVEERFWSRVQRTTEDACWPWTGRLVGMGYGQITVAGRARPAHRVAYELLVGPIPVGLVIDHLCRNPSCVNPVHLEPVTNRENILRGVSAPAQNARKTHCKHGHPFKGENVYEQNGERRCRECHRAKNLRFYHRAKRSRAKDGRPPRKQSKVTREFLSDAGVWMHELECGHMLAAPEFRSPLSRVCSYCAEQVAALGLFTPDTEEPT